MNDTSKTFTETPVQNKKQVRFWSALVLGAAAGIFIGLLGMAIAILMLGVLSLGLPDISFKIAGLSATAVAFVVFCALGWAGASLFIWRKLSSSP